MGRNSIKNDKSPFQLRREELKYSRAVASEKTNIPEDRIEKLENGRIEITPIDAKDFANGYNAPDLCNYYCSNICPIGIGNIPEIKDMDLRQITLEMLNSFNIISKQQERLIEISVDNEIQEDEIRDFAEIQNQLENISTLVKTLQHWSNQMIADGKIDIEIYNKYRK